MRVVNGWIYCRLILYSIFKVIIEPFNTGLPLLVNSSLCSPSLTLSLILSLSLSTPTLYTELIYCHSSWMSAHNYSMGNRWSCSKNSPWLSRRLMLSEKPVLLRPWRVTLLSPLAARTVLAAWHGACVP